MRTKNDLITTRDLANQVEGWLTDREGAWLYQMSQSLSGRGVIVEIGSWKGKSSIWLARGSKAARQVPVYAIDPHTGNPEHTQLYGDDCGTFHAFQQTLRHTNIEDIVSPLVQTSREAVQDWHQPIELLFIDGAHSYAAVKADLVHWSPHVVEHGIIAIHDTTACLRPLLSGYPGPKRVVDEYVFQSSRLKDVGVVDTITFARKCQHMTADEYTQRQRVRRQKRVFDLFHVIFWGFLELPLPKPLRRLLCQAG